MTKHITLKDGNKMPSLGFGTWQLNGSECVESLGTALDSGYTHIDTAEMYENEAEIGKVLKNRDRGKLFITSKVQPFNLKYDSVIESCSNSLEKLGTDYLDMYLIHWPNKDSNLEETLKAFVQLRDEGKIKSAGVSNFTTAHIKEAMPVCEKLGITITNNQVEFHPGLYQKELLDFCRENQITVTAYSPLGRSEILENDIITTIAKNHDKNPAQVCIRWSLQKGLVVIPKASSVEHIKQNLQVFDFELNSSEMEKIDSLGADNRLISPEWAEFDKTD